MNIFIYLAGGTIEGPPGIIVGPISAFFGAIINFLFMVADFITPVGALGISIILVTFIFRTLMLPAFIKMQKSNMKMRSLKPELDKIKEKYGDTKDPELKRKMMAEQQTLYSKNGINPLASCLPMLVTMPIFFAMMFIMRNIFLYVGPVGDAYTELSQFLAYYAFGGIEGFGASPLIGIINSRMPSNLELDLYVQGVGIVAENMNRVIVALSYSDWQTVFEAVNPEHLARVQELYAQRVAIESFIGISMVGNPGWGFPGMIIPILSGGTSFLATFMQQKTMPIQGGNKTLQKVMLFMMPGLMLWWTSFIAAGVGLYWIAGNIYQIGQQYFIQKHFQKKMAKGEVI